MASKNLYIYVYMYANLYRLYSIKQKCKVWNYLETRVTIVKKYKCRQ